MAAERFPLDFDALQRGIYLPPETVEKAVLKSRTDPDYWAAVLRLREEIRKHFQGRGDFVTVVCEKDGLRILTHVEQADYAPGREQQAIRQIVVAQLEGRAVDVQQLGDEQRARHERWLHRNSFRLQQLRKRPPPELT